MASAKEIQNRIKSVQDTMKITNAMFMIASSKLRKAKKEVEVSGPYFRAMRQTIAAIQDYAPAVQNRYYDKRPDKSGKDRTYGYLVLTADKGISGSYNHNVVKLVQKELDKHPGQNALYVAGRLGRHLYRKQGENVMHQFHYVVEDPSLTRVREVSHRVLADYNEGKIDELYMVYTRMNTPMSCETKVSKLLPLDEETFQDIPDGKYREVELFPTPEAVLDNVIPIYLHGVIYGALVASFCSEQNSRMLAMQSATNNAKEMLHDLSIQYNRIRQTAITQEITEVIAGARAQRQKQ